MKIEIIAEAGVGHNGDVNLARRMVDAARNAGADIVKFQTYSPEEAINPHHKDFDYLKSLALSHKEFLGLAKHCEQVGIEFLSTPGDLSSFKFLVEECGVKRVKIGSDDLTYAPLIEAAYKVGLPTILSTGMATLAEIRTVHDRWNEWDLWRVHTVPLTLLHCVSSYPVPPEDANLRAMLTLKNEFHRPIGYSDHCEGYVACLAAATMGATIIEKHFELAEITGPDHAVSLKMLDFVAMVEGIRKIEKMMAGTGKKEPNAAELELLPLVRKREDGRKLA